MVVELIRCGGKYFSAMGLKMIFNFLVRSYKNVSIPSNNSQDDGLLASANMRVSYTRPPDWPTARPSVPRPALAQRKIVTTAANSRYAGAL